VYGNLLMKQMVYAPGKGLMQVYWQHPLSRKSFQVMMLQLHCNDHQQQVPVSNEHRF